MIDVNEMSAAAQTLDYVKTLVWPGVVVIALMTFRPQLAKLISRVQEVSAAGASVKFSQQVAELADAADSVMREVQRSEKGAARTITPIPVPTGDQLDPTVAFLEAYGELEVAARDAAQAAGATSTLLIPVVRALVEKQVVPEDTVRVAEELRAIRNRVAHGLQRLTADEAQSLITVARSLATACSLGARP